MRYTVLLLLLSACASVPESPTGTYYAGGSASGPGAGYVQAAAVPPVAPCYGAGYPPVMGPPYFSSYNCAPTPLSYSPLPYYSYYPVRMSAARGVHAWRTRPSGAGPVTGRRAAGHAGKRK